MTFCRGLFIAAAAAGADAVGAVASVTFTVAVTDICVAFGFWL